MLADTAIVRASSAAPPAGLATWQCDADTRFTLLTDRAVRAEYGIFENRRSFAFTPARQPLPTGASVALHNDSSWCNATVSGSGMRVSYRKLPLVSHPAGALLTQAANSRNASSKAKRSSARNARSSWLCPARKTWVSCAAIRIVAR